MSDFKAKMHQIRFRLGLRPRSRWGAYSAPPDPLAGFKGPTSKGREGRKGGKGGEGSGGIGREEGEGVGAPFNVLPPGATDLVAPLK